jgi:hypothetical protein
MEPHHYFIIGTTLLAIAAFVHFIIVPQLREGLDPEEDFTCAEVEDFEAQNPGVQEEDEVPFSRIHDKALGLIPEGSIALAMQPENNQKSKAAPYIAVGAVIALVVYILMNGQRRD